MKIGAHLGYLKTGDGLFHRAKQLGLQALQIFIGETHTFFPFNYSPAQLELIKFQKESAALKLAVHGCYVVNIAYNGSERNKFKLGIKSIVSQLELADRMGADFLVMHVGSFKEQGREQGIQNLTEASKAILDNYKGNCALLYENSAGGGTQIGHVPMLAEVVDKLSYEKLGLCVDTTHAYAAGMPFDDVDFRRQFWNEYRFMTDWVHYNMPDPNVVLGGHLDRHRVSWKDGKWPVETMIDIAREMSHMDIPLCMEADNNAYEINIMYLEEAGLF